jgi:sulfopyruvate decarboxylase TPP-binding subunit
VPSSDALTKPAVSSRVAAALLAMEFDVAIGVPDSHLKLLVAELESSMTIHVAPREDAAVAAACGLTLAGHRPLVYMKNAGLFTCGDALVSLAEDIFVPVAMVIGWAGTGTDTLPHHVVSGARTVALLEALGVAWRTAGDLADGPVEWLDECRIRRQHAAILVRPGGAHG